MRSMRVLCGGVAGKNNLGRVTLVAIAVSVCMTLFSIIMANERSGVRSTLNGRVRDVLKCSYRHRNVTNFR